MTYEHGNRIREAISGANAGGLRAHPGRTESAQELMVAGRSCGFTFAADAMEKGRPYSRELADFVSGRFREMGKADDASVLTL